MSYGDVKRATFDSLRIKCAVGWRRLALKAWEGRAECGIRGLNGNIGKGSGSGHSKGGSRVKPETSGVPHF